MVALLAIPQFNDIALTTKVVAERAGGKHKVYFANYLNSWIARIQEYDDKQGDPSTISPSIIPLDESGRFVNLYESHDDENSQRPVIKALRDNKLLFCPSCGEDGKPETLDHYLPKTHYPEYSILTKNLVPMCSKCQGVKLAEVLSNSGQRQFIHPYFDKITFPLFYVVVHTPYLAPSNFEVLICDNLPPQLRELAARHIRALDIDTRFSDYCREKYIHLLKITSEMRESDESIAQMLPVFIRMESMKTINSWPAVFYRSVLMDKSLMQYLEGDSLPKYI